VAFTSGQTWRAEFSQNSPTQMNAPNPTTPVRNATNIEPPWSTLRMAERCTPMPHQPTPTTSTTTSTSHSSAAAHGASVLGKKWPASRTACTSPQTSAVLTVTATTSGSRPCQCRRR